jgi:hypothetical protein
MSTKKQVKKEEPVNSVGQLTDVEKAKILLDKEKQNRAESFHQELNLLCEKYNCQILPGQIIIKAN